MTRELSKTEKALRLIAKEGITAKEAAERVGISPAAVSKGRLWPSKAAQNVRKLCEMENEIEFLRSELATLTKQRDLAVDALEDVRKELQQSNNRLYEECEILDRVMAMVLKNLNALSLN